MPFWLYSSTKRFGKLTITSWTVTPPWVIKQIETANLKAIFTIVFIPYSSISEQWIYNISHQIIYKLNFSIPNITQRFLLEKSVRTHYHWKFQWERVLTESNPVSSRSNQHNQWERELTESNPVRTRSHWKFQWVRVLTSTISENAFSLKKSSENAFSLGLLIPCNTCIITPQRYSESGKNYSCQQ